MSVIGDDNPRRDRQRRGFVYLNFYLDVSSCDWITLAGSGSRPENGPMRSGNPSRSRRGGLVADVLNQI